MAIPAVKLMKRRHHVHGDHQRCTEDHQRCTEDHQRCREVHLPQGAERYTYHRVQGGHIHYSVQGGIYTTRCREEATYPPWCREEGYLPTMMPTIPPCIYTLPYHPGYTTLPYPAVLVNGAALLIGCAQCSGLWSEINNGDKAQRGSQGSKGVKVGRQ